MLGQAHLFLSFDSHNHGSNDRYGFQELG